MQMVFQTGYSRSPSILGPTCVSEKPKRGRNHRQTSKVSCLLAALIMMLLLASQSDASLNVKSDRAILKPCDIAKFTITVSNSGETPLDTVQMVDKLPPGMSYVSDDRSGKVQGHEILWSNLGRLDIGESTPVHLATRIGPRERGRLENQVTVTGTPPTGYNVTDKDTEDVFVAASAKKKSAGNIDRIGLGDQKAAAFGPSGRAGSTAVASNQNEIKKAQSRNQGSDCGHNLIDVQAGDQSAIAHNSAVALNKRKIVSAQR